MSGSKYIVSPRGKSGTPLIDRMMLRVNKTDDCWVWIGSTSPDGYGKYSYRTSRATKKGSSAHRIIYELLIGAVQSGKELDHLCRNRLCVNPTHLEQVTRRENILRSNNFIAKQVLSTHCKYGHERNKENIYYRKSGGRDCKICIKNRNNKKRG